MPETASSPLKANPPGAAPRRSWLRCAWQALRNSPQEAERYWLTRFVFLRLLGLVYAVAFLSLAQQILPLVGRRGLLPAQLFLRQVQAGLGSTAEAWFKVPTLFWLGASDGFLGAMAWAGVALSLVVLAGFANAILMTVLWFVYLSFVHIGQDWTSYGWEIQLLETGFLAIFLCPLLDARPFPRRAPPRQVIWLLRWLIFRIMLGAGLIKIRGDACWRDLTALYYHYETQPIPNPLSRLLHFMPRWFHQFGCLCNHFTELIVPFFAFWPPRVRRAAGVLFVLFQIILILSGNLSFLNWLTICPAIACLDDGFWRRVFPQRVVSWADRAAREARPSKPQNVTAWALVAVVALLSIAPVTNLLSSRQIMNTSFSPFHLVNTYGAFGSVGRERYEIILEGTEDAGITPETRWKAYEFKAKPGDPDRGLPIVSPYHYRVDWQIWFAAMSIPRRHPWLIHLMWKLLGNEPAALGLIANNPFPGQPPRFIRAELYRYHFAPTGSDRTWDRTREGTWLPPLSRDDPGLRRFLVSQGWIDGSEGEEPGPK